MSVFTKLGEQLNALELIFIITACGWTGDNDFFFRDLNLCTCELQLQTDSLSLFHHVFHTTFYIISKSSSPLSLCCTLHALYEVTHLKSKLIHVWVCCNEASEKHCLKLHSGMNWFFKKNNSRPFILSFLWVLWVFRTKCFFFLFSLFSFFCCQSVSKWELKGT